MKVKTSLFFFWRMVWMATAWVLPGFAICQTFVPRPETMKMKMVADLNGIWLDPESHFINVPYWDSESAPAQLSKNFVFQAAKVPDGGKIFLLFEGVAMSADIFLNEKFLGTIEDPFAYSLFQIRKEWLQQDPNVLRVEMNAVGKSKFLYPENFTGIFRPVWLLTEGEFQSLKIPNYESEAEEALIVAPWTEINGPMDDSAGFNRMLRDLKSSGQNRIYFAFPPSSWQLQATAAHGISILRSLKKTQRLAFYNHYPPSRPFNPFSTPFWTQLGAHNPGYGKFFSREFLQSPIANPPDNLALFFFSALPILFLVILRLFSSRVYESLLQFVTKPNIYLDLITGSNFLGQWETQLMNFFRLVIGAIVASMVLYFFSINRQYANLNFLGDDSILHAFLSSADRSLYLLFLFCFAFLAIVNLMRYFILAIVGWIYSLHGINEEVVGIDIFASFPLNIFPIFPALLLFFADGWLLGTVKMALFFLILIFYFRRLWAIFAGLGKSLRVSAGIKILYICTFEILPWFILV